VRWLARPAPLWVVLVSVALCVTGQTYVVIQTSPPSRAEDFQLSQVPLCEVGVAAGKLYDYSPVMGLTADYCISALAIARYLADPPCWRASADFLDPHAADIRCNDAIATGRAFQDGSFRLGDERAHP